MVKICPKCHTENPVSAAFCKKCKFSLLMVPPTNEMSAPENNQMAEHEREKEQSDGSEAIWSDQDKTNTSVKTIRIKSEYTLIHLLSRSVLKMRFGEIIGRENQQQQEWFKKYISISRKHCRIIIKNNKYFLIDLGSTNGTFYEGEMCMSGQEIEIESGHRIRIADQEFVFNAGDEQ